MSAVCPSVTFRHRDDIGWNTSKILSRLISIRDMLGLTPNMGHLVEDPQKLGGIGVGHEHKKLQYL